MNCKNCVDNKGEPIIGYAGACITDYRSNNELQNDLRQILSRNGCNSGSSYDFSRCMQNNADVVFSFLKKNFNNALSTSECNSNSDNN